MFITDYSKLRQILAILPVAVDEFAIGLAYGWVSPTIKYLQKPNDDLYLDNDQITWVASLHELGRLLGPFVVPLLSRFLGRKPILTITALLYVASWLAIVTTRSLPILYVARLIVGIGIGFSDVCSCMYVGEITTPDIRGRCLTVIHFIYLTGILTAYVFGTYLSYSVHAIVILTVTFVQLLSCLLLVETPHYLLTAVKSEERALENLTKIRPNDHNSVRKEFDELRKYLSSTDDDERNDKRRILTDPVNLKILCLTVSVSILGTATGFYALSYYSNLIFPSNRQLTSNEFTIMFGTMQCLSVAAASVAIDRYGRRFLLLTFSSGAVLLHATSAILYTLKNVYRLEIPGFSWLIFTTIAAYSALYTFGFSPVSFTLRAEVFPQTIKSFGGSLIVLMQSTVVFAQTKMFMLIADVFGIYANFLLYAAGGTGIFLITYFKLPETKGKTLAEIQAYFKDDY